MNMEIQITISEIISPPLRPMTFHRTGGASIVRTLLKQWGVDCEGNCTRRISSHPNTAQPSGTFLRARFTTAGSTRLATLLSTYTGRNILVDEV